MSRATGEMPRSAQRVGRSNAAPARKVQRGVPKDHLRSKGYGKYCPEDPAHNMAAWDKNRRVEFKILKTKDGPTGVEVGCAGAEKRGVHWFASPWDVPSVDFLNEFEVPAHKVASAAMQAFQADGVTVQQFSEPAGGQVVFHLHMHVMPRHNGIALLPPASRKEDVKVLEDNATKLIAALAG